MPITYLSKAKDTVMQPFFGRFRQTYRGARNSTVENRESNFFIIDINKINNSLTKTESNINNISDNFVGNLNNLLDYQKYSDGLFYDLRPIKVYYDDTTGLNPQQETDFLLNKLNGLSAILAKLKTKVTRLENGR
jgi:t-SNARE complex subunit (syntaxin)